MCMKAPYTTIVCTEENRIATIVLNCPERLNALDPTMLAELTDALQEAGEDKDVKVIVLTGSGKAFCAGGDVSTFQSLSGETSYEYMKTSQQVVGAFKRTAKPIIAAVNGFAVGAGLSLALLSDIIIASDKAKFGAAFIKVGLVPDLGLLYTLPRAVGLHKAYEMAVTGQNIDAAEALRLGLVNTVAEHEKLAETVAETAKLLADHPARAMGYAKTLMNRGLAMGLDEVLEAEALAQASLLVSEDAKEGVDAFLNKRSPEFK